jgi:hypothetical protein
MLNPESALVNRKLAAATIYCVYPDPSLNFCLVIRGRALPLVGDLDRCTLPLERETLASLTLALTLH